jgi:hypothetical protein
MKNLKRLLGALLIVLAIVLVLVQVSRMKSNTGKDSLATANLLVSEMRQYMRSPVDSVLAEIDDTLAARPRPNENQVFEVLRLSKEAGRVHHAFTETNARTLMDPYDRETIPPSPLGFGMMTLSTTGSVLPVQDELDAVSALERDRTRQGLEPTSLVRFMKGEKDSPQIWLVRPFITDEDTVVKELGIGFLPLTTVDPYIAGILNEAFPKSPVWRNAATSAGKVEYTLELVNPAGEIAYAIGEKTDKVSALKINLEQSDLGYRGWTINVWMPRPPSAFGLFAAAALSLIVGIILILK